MTVVGREQSIGESIRQLRRQQNLTQSELGGERYSKSYVSALERDKITPSLQALQFFAGQLGQSDNYFTTLFEQTEHLKQLAVLYEQSHINTGERHVPE
jgi:transcriptional regulator with XRE-family HTH domain